jgi:hypothetical protein
MSSLERAAVRDTNSGALRQACAVIAAAQTSEGLDDGEVQALLGAAVRLYAQRAADRDEPMAAFDAAKSEVTATDAMIATTAILKAVNIATFELGMWQSWTRG